MATMIFVNLPVKDLDKSKKFYSALGYTLNEQFSDDNTASFVISDTIVVMLLKEDKFREFSTKPIADSGAVTEALLCLSADSREDVDRITEIALSSGGSKAKDPQDMGFMYGRSYLDPDGHHWELAYMDPAALEG
ncbi:VOC family protein [Yinghuangia sp. YIM S09857]|uniref:VOC family protein n=1 Tax=Yinghuangia sp. YIM S09857 TaxID=3436929 RepID=UPI003F5381C8